MLIECIQSALMDDFVQVNWEDFVQVVKVNWIDVHLFQEIEHHYVTVMIEYQQKLPIK